MSLSECVRKFECVCAEFIVSEIIIGAPKIWCNPIINIPILQYLRCKWGTTTISLAHFPLPPTLPQIKLKFPMLKHSNTKYDFYLTPWSPPPPHFIFGY